MKPKPDNSSQKIVAAASEGVDEAKARQVLEYRSRRFVNSSIFFSLFSPIFRFFDDK